MTLINCTICEKNKTALKCYDCGSASCKNCVEFIDEDSVEFVVLLPDELRNKTFCQNCYSQTILDKITKYRDIAARAKQVDVYTKTQTKETRRIKRVEEPLKIVDCEDRDEVLLRLAFLAAEKGFDTLIDVDVTYRKVGEGKSYRKLVWTGTAIPADPSIEK